MNATLRDKIKYTSERIIEWHFYFSGKVWVSFSAGKDSTVLLHLVRSLYPDVPAVYCNTGQEHPANIKFAKTIANLKILKPELSFKQVIRKYGYPVGGKKISRAIRDLQNPTERNVATRNLHLTGINRKGEFHKSSKLANRWVKLAQTASFKVSEQCCYYIKERPLINYANKTKSYPYVGTRSTESDLRKFNHNKFGCNLYESKIKMSRPLRYWTDEDINTYIKDHNVQISEAYTVFKETRTGCMFCPMGAHLEKGDQKRFIRMKKLYPKWHKCIYNLELNKVFDAIGVSYE